MSRDRFKSDRVSGLECFGVFFDEFVNIVACFWAAAECICACRNSLKMKRSSEVHESCGRQPAAKRGWGLGSLLHGLAGYVRPKSGAVKEKFNCSAVDSETAALPRDLRDYQTTSRARTAADDQTAGNTESVRTAANFHNVTSCEASGHAPKFDSALSRSSTFHHTLSRSDADGQRPRTPLLPRFRRDARNR